MTKFDRTNNPTTKERVPIALRIKKIMNLKILKIQPPTDCPRILPKDGTESESEVERRGYSASRQCPHPVGRVTKG